MRTATIVTADNEVRKSQIRVAGNKRSRDTDLILKTHWTGGSKDLCGDVLHPNHVRALRRALAEREAELVAAGHLEVEE